MSAVGPASIDVEGLMAEFEDLRRLEDVARLRTAYARGDEVEVARLARSLGWSNAAATSLAEAPVPATPAATATPLLNDKPSLPSDDGIRETVEIGTLESRMDSAERDIAHTRNMVRFITEPDDDE